MLRQHVEFGRLRFTSSFDECTEFGDVHFLCMSTPQRDGELAADLGHVDQAVSSLARRLTRACIIAGKSTVPDGTAERLADLVHSLAPAGTDMVLAWNPEFLREGFAIEDTLSPGRLVFGLPDDVSAAHAAQEMLGEVYAEWIAADTPVVLADLATAQLTKSAANAFLATKISLHQRDGRAVRGHRGRRHRPRRRHRVRPPDRAQLPQRGPRVRRRLPPQGHPWLHS